MPASGTAGASLRHLPPVIDVVLLEHTGGAVVGLAAEAKRALQCVRGVPLQQHKMPELGLQRPSWQREPQPENAVRENRMISQLYPAGAECAEPSLRFRHRCLVILLEQ